MRLINVHTLQLQEFFGPGSTPPYAILSHTWEAGEVSYQDIQNLALAQEKAGFAKIFYTCAQAKENRLDWAWVDTCCIDKSSSTELSEAINSMFAWYTNAAVCYVYLQDVSAACPELGDETCFHPAQLRWIEAFEETRWFSRGWTLQELIAPRRVVFFGEGWNFIGTLAALLGRVSGITGIQTDILSHERPLREISTACRLSWAAKRNTTRLEDQAYSLVGILDVNMDLRYGEGSKAFYRLQQEIVRQSTDQSIFAWDAPQDFIAQRDLLLAPSPRCFANSGKIRTRFGNASTKAFFLSNKGLEITLPTLQRQLSRDPTRPDVTLGILDCQYKDSKNLLALVMRQHPLNIDARNPSVELYVSGTERPLGDTYQHVRLIEVKPRDLECAKTIPVTITNDLRSQPYMQSFDANDHTAFPVWFMGDETSAPTLAGVFPEWCWSSATRTMKLRPPRDVCGGVVIRTRGDSRSVLLIFGLNEANRRMSSSSPRKIYDIVPFDGECAIEPHLHSILRNRTRERKESISFNLNKDERITARLWGGALTVTIDNNSNGSSTFPLSPTVSPTSPRGRPPPSPGPQRHDSLLQETRSDHSTTSSHSNDEQTVHRTSQCRNCRRVRAEDDSKRKEVEKERVARKKIERNKTIASHAQKAGVGLSLGSMLIDGLEFLG